LTGDDQLLLKLKPIEIDTHRRKECLPSTRLDVIKSIIEWMMDESKDCRRVLWLNGLAGSGKSTLSTTIAWLMRDLHRLGGFFFFDRDIPGRSATTLIRTLAYRLSQLDDRFGVAISRIVASNPNITEMPSALQFMTLLSAGALESVEWFGGPVIFIVDSMDECPNVADRRILIQALAKGFSNLPPFIRVMVVSRPEPDIQQVLDCHPHVLPFALEIDSATNKKDVSQFIQYGLEEIRTKNRFLGPRWPDEDRVSALINSSGGLFVWASTACLYIDGYDPDKKLEELIAHQPAINYSEPDDPFAQLDKLYKTGLQSAPHWHDHSFRADCRDILGVVLCARDPLSHSAIDVLLELPPNRACLQSISHLGCVLHVSKSERIRILHPSFHDYLAKRCNAEPWSVDLELHNKKLGLHCVELLDKELHENICDMTLPHLAQKIALSEPIIYACKFWIEHICLISYATEDIVDRIYKFLGRNLLHWMEALAILKCHDHTIRSLQRLLGWLVVCHLNYARDTCH
jgi:hypothetical protein